MVPETLPGTEQELWCNEGKRSQKEETGIEPASTLK